MTREEALKWNNPFKSYTNEHKEYFDLFINNIYDDFENRSCDWCIYKLQTTFKDYNCHKCSRFYDDKFVKDK